MALDRRTFLGLAGSAAGTAATGAVLWKVGAQGSTAPVVQEATGPTTTATPTTAPPPTPLPATTTSAAPTEVEGGNRTLVLIQMGGGNDGLNTVVPESGAYRDARPTIALSEESLVGLSGLPSVWLHPALGPLADMWDADQLAMVQGVALPEQSRSHFVALDTWWAATPELASAGGWLGRWLDVTATPDSGSLRAVALGGGAPAATAVDTRPVIVQDLDGFVLSPPRRSQGVVDAFTAMAFPEAPGLFGRAQAAIPDSVGAVETLQEVFTAAPSVETTFEIERLFHAAASIIEADLGTQVIVINMGGFDTHSDQLARHEELLGGLANGVSAMYGRLAASGHADRTATLAFSEFGRRVAENGSGGTDHGTAGLAFVFGPPVAGRQLVGGVDLGDLDNGDLRPDIDARSVYADVLDWLGGPTEDVLGGRYDSYALL